MSRQRFAVFLGMFFVMGVLVASAANPVLRVRYVAGETISPVASAVTVREVLATGQPASAPGQTLDLVRYTIPPGTTLAVHVHPGMQIAWVQTGELTYHVLKGEVQIGRAANASGGAPGATETLSAGESTDLTQGDWVAEVPGAVHYGENLDSEPVVLWAATLLETGQPPAIPVNDEGTPIA